MRLTGIEIQNYRSITRATKLQLDPRLTVIVGPNNEGKSNILRAIVLAMEYLRRYRQPAGLGHAPFGRDSWRPLMYDWERDFPLARQRNKPDGETLLKLQFALTPEEQALFKREVGCSTNDALPLEITFGSNGSSVRVRKQGHGSKTYEAKSKQIASFISRRIEFQYIPAIRPSQLSLETIGVMVDRALNVLVTDPDYKRALETIEQLQAPVFERLAADVQAQLSKLLPSVRSVVVSMPQTEGFRSRFRTPELIVDDGTPTELEAKGDGIKSLVAISLMRAATGGSAAGDLVVAVEEPESHLHPGAVRQLGQVLQEMADEHQVIVTTHSPLLVARGRPGANIIVSKSKAKHAQTVRELREVLGVEVQDNLSSAQFVILVEGPHDATVLDAVFGAISEPFRRLRDSGRLEFETLKGVDNVCYKLSALFQQVTTPFLLLDDDAAGRRAADKARSRSHLDDKYIYLLKLDAKTESELEDHLSCDCYWAALCGRYGAKPDRGVFELSPEKWTKRMKAAFNNAGKSWDDDVASNAKALVKECVLKDPLTAIAAGGRDVLQRIVDGITTTIAAER